MIQIYLKIKILTKLKSILKIKLKQLETVKLELKNPLYCTSFTKIFEQTLETFKKIIIF